jgi:UrcA family protein
MKEPKLITSLLAASIVVFLGSPAVVLACTAFELYGEVHSHVSYSDLDLESTDGVQELYERLQQASRKTCSVTSPMNDGTIAWRSCYRHTLSDTVEKFDNEDLSKVHENLIK